MLAKHRQWANLVSLESICTNNEEGMNLPKLAKNCIGRLQEKNTQMAIINKNNQKMLISPINNVNQNKTKKFHLTDRQMLKCWNG